MQLYLPYPDFEKSVQCLTTNHLNRVRTNCQLMAKAFLEPSRWCYHPSFKAWKPYYKAFQYYHDCVVKEWIGRGFNTKAVLFGAPKPERKDMPWFIGNDRYHSSMRSNLIRLNFTYKERCEWVEDGKQPYLWPNNNTYQLDLILLSQ